MRRPGSTPGGERPAVAALTPEELSRLAMERARSKRTRQEAGGGIPRRRESAPAPLSFAQQRLWLLDRLDPGNPSYDIPFAAWLRGEAVPRLLAAGLAGVVRRHEALRTRFAERDGEPVQLVDPPGAFPLPAVDLSGLPPAVARQVAAGALATDAATPFDLARGPLFRARLLRLDRRCHLLALNVHHVVADGWSYGVLLRELAALYAAAAQGRPAPLPPLPIQYADFAVWQRRRLAGPLLAEQLAYWRRQLAGAPPALELPTDRPRPPLQTNRGERADATLPADLTAALKKLARRLEATPFMLLLALFQLLLARLAGQQDVVVGAPSAGRSRVETEGLVGCFLNALVLRTDLSGDPTLSRLVARVREVVLGAYRYQELPFEKLLEELQPERALSRSPLFQVQFNMLALPEIRLALPGVEVEPAAAPERFAKFDLNLYAEEGAAGLELALVYNADLFDRRRMRELLAQLEHLAEQAVADPERPIGRLSLRTPGAAAVLPDPRQPLAGGWQGAVHERLALHAARCPERPAVADEEEVWTYGELEARANRLARWLRGQGLASGDAVAVYAHRSAALAWAVLGALKAGGAFLLLDAVYPAARLAHYLALARPRAWIALARAGAPPAALTAALDGIGCRIRLDLPPGPAGEDPLAALPATDPGVAVGPEDLAAISFTSGSTGEPKGVLGRHGPLSFFQPQWGERFGLAAGDRFGMLSGLSHDPLQRDLFSPLWLGALLVVPEPERIGTPGRLAAWAAERALTVLHLTPAMMELLAGDAEEGAAERLRLPALRRAFVVGDLLKRREVARLEATAPAVAVINLYGSTETQRAVAFQPVAKAAGRATREAIPLGKGLEGVQLLVLTGAGSLAGIGELGEIHLRSRHLARGYLGDPALTAARFRANPFREPETAPAAGGADRLYRTGDLGRYLPDGSVEFAGRGDGQVKIRGFRIELGEVETALRDHPSVSGCVVVVRENERGEKVLAAYLTPREGAGPRELRESLSRRLPDYMVPTAFLRLAKLPMTGTGKVDRRALPPLADLAAAAEGEAGAAPRTPLEELLAGVWAELLGRRGVGVDEDFFALGGHSLLAIRMLARLREATGVEVPLRALFESPTVSGLAAAAEARRGRRRPARPELVPVPRHPGVPLPLSFAQRRLWFLDQLEPGNPAYNLAAAITLDGRLEAGALAAALGAIASRHEALRSSFPTADGEPAVAIAPPGPFPLPRVDLAGLAAAALPALARALAAAAARRPFDLTVGPLLRATLLVLGAARHALLLTFHHAVADGWSLGLFAGELSALYGAFRAGEPSPLPPPALQYPDHAVWQRRWLTGEVLDAELALWKDLLAGAPGLLELPADRPRPAARSYLGGRLEEVLPAAAAGALEAAARRSGATLFMLLLAAYAALLERTCGQADLVIGTPIAGRDDPRLEGLIGLFANTLALRLDAAGDPPFAQLLRRVRETSLTAFAHPDLPFERLVDELAPERTLSHSPLFQVMFVLQNVPDVDLELPGLTSGLLGVDYARAPFDLTLTAARLPGGLLVRLEYAADLFDRTTAARLLRGWRTLLAGAAADPGRRLSELPLLEAAERHQLLVSRNDTAASFAAERCLHELLTAAAAPQLQAVAVAGAGEHLTHGEVAARAGEVARALQRLGVGPEARVGLCMERRPGLLPALLGILEAGGAYVPLDPAHPAERLAWIVADAGLAALAGTPGELARLPAGGAPRLALDSGGAPAAGAGGPAGHPRPPAAAGPDNLAYVIYTSGSTGRPKGVAVPHRGVVNFLAAMAERPGLGSDDRLLALTTLAFDISVLELFLPLLAGARVELVERETAADPARLAAALEAVAATVLQATPATWRLLLEGGWPGRQGLRALCGGEALTPALAGRLAPRVGRLWNVYGPTETTVWASVHPLASGAAGERPAPLGGPIPNLSFHVVDRRGRALPLGAPGELWIGGVGLARGYLGRPARTAEAFVPDPFGEVAGSRLYRSGDLVRALPRGGLDYLGRIDFQVKVRGFRIELGEVEAALARQPEVGQAVAAVRADEAGERRLVAYLLAAPGEEIDAAALRRALADSLPDFMVPSLLVPVADLPLTPSGKVDRKALARRPLQLAAAVAHTPPRTAAEEVVAAVWAEVLGRRRVGVDDNFFALGGDSILAIRVVARCAAAGVRFAPRDLFRHQTVAALAAAAEVRALAAEEGRSLPLTAEQRRLLAGGEPAVAGVLLEVPAAVAPAAVEAALAALPDRFESLRLALRRQAGGWSQRPLAAGEVPVARLAGPPPDPGDGGGLLGSFAELARRLDPGAGRLLAAAWLPAPGGASHRLLLAAHRLAMDDASWEPLLATLAAGAGPGLAARLAPAVLHLAALAGSPPSAGDLRALEAAGAGSTALLPVEATDAAGPAAEEGRSTEDSARHAEIAVELPDAVSRSFADVVADDAASPTELLLAAVLEVLAGWLGSRRMVVEVAGDGEERLLLGLDAGAVGCFLLPLPVLLEVERGALRTLAAVGEQLRRARRLAAVHGRVAGDGGARAEVAVRWWRAAEPAPGWRASPLYPPSAGGPLLTVTGCSSRGRLRIAWSYDPRLHRPRTVTALAEGTAAAIANLVQQLAVPAGGSPATAAFAHAGLSRDELEELISEL
jgi:amino acid adenylation domain-containing protein